MCLQWCCSNDWVEAAGESWDGSTRLGGAVPRLGCGSTRLVGWLRSWMVVHPNWVNRLLGWSWSAQIGWKAPESPCRSNQSGWKAPEAPDRVGPVGRTATEPTLASAQDGGGPAEFPRSGVRPGADPQTARPHAISGGLNLASDTGRCEEVSLRESKGRRRDARRSLLSKT
jgi:hypothetical protein